MATAIFWLTRNRGEGTHYRAVSLRRCCPSARIHRAAHQRRCCLSAHLPQPWPTACQPRCCPSALRGPRCCLSAHGGAVLYPARTALPISAGAVPQLRDGRCCLSAQRPADLQRGVLPVSTSLPVLSISTRVFLTTCAPNAHNKNESPKAVTQLRMRRNGATSVDQVMSVMISPFDSM